MAKDSQSPHVFPQMLGHYRLLDLLGKGGMGEIFLAEDPLFERKIALKKILPKLIPYASIKKRFLNEAKIAAQLAHPSIIPIYSLHVTADQIYYTMPYIKGDTLKKILKQTRDQEKTGTTLHPLGSSIPALMRVFLSVCQAIDYTHANGFLHRDVKPENIIVGKFGEVMILDWGIAHRMHDEESPQETLDFDLEALHPNTPTSHFTDLTRPGKVVGTVNYMAPERAFGESSTVQTDVYSLGILLYQLLTLRLPFTRPSLKDFKKILHQERWIEPQQLAPHRDIPLKLALLAKKCIHPNPELRFHSVREVIAELEDYIEGRPAWILASQLCPKSPHDWEFQENIPLTKRTAISRLSGHVEWVMLMISKESYSGNTKISSKVTLRTHSSGIGFLLCIPDTKERAGLEEGYLVWIGSESHPGCKLFRAGVEMLSVVDKALICESSYDISIEKSDSHLRLLINGYMVFDYISHLPLIGGHIGLLSRDASFAIDHLNVLLGSQSAQVNCLAIPDAFLTSKDYKHALSEYRRIAHSFQGRAEAREALFRAGITLLEEGKAAHTAEKRESAFNEALSEFEKLSNTPGAPLEYLGKSFVYHAQDHFDEEMKCLELALRKYAKHPLLPLLEEHISFRLHEAAGKKRQATYSLLLLALRHLPHIIASKETQSLIDDLTASWELLPFLDAPKTFSSPQAQNFCIAIHLAFWLMKPTILYELTQKLDSDAPESAQLFQNIFFALLEMDDPKLALYVHKRFLETHSPAKTGSLTTIATFLRRREKDPLVTKVQQALSDFPQRASLEEKRFLYSLLHRGLLLDQAKELCALTREVSCPFFLPLQTWLALLCRDQIAAKELIDRADHTDFISRNSPYYVLYGCYLALTSGEAKAKRHFFTPLDAPYPPMAALLSYYLTDTERVKTHWLPQAFSPEKIELYRQLALYFCCLGQEDKARSFEKLLQEEQRISHTFLHFL